MDYRMRIAGMIWGAVMGDALGVPVEFRRREELDGDPVEGLRGYGTHHQPPGTWSDDSSLLLAGIMNDPGDPEPQEALDAAVEKAWSDFDQEAPDALTAEVGQFECLREMSALRDRPRSEVSGSGYVVDCLVASVWSVATSGNFREAVLKAVNLGEDTDTTGCVTGALAGCLWSDTSLPEAWVGHVARHGEIAALTSRAIGR